MHLVCAWAVVVALATQAHADPAVREAKLPALSGRVVDEGQLLGAQAAPLAEALAALERASGVQLVVLTMPSLGDEPIEPFAIRVAERWQLGQRGRDNGLLLVAVRSPPRMRLEVGYGLEEVIPDVLAARLVQEAVYDGQLDGARIQRVIAAIGAHLQAHADQVREGRGRGIVHNVANAQMGMVYLGLLLIFVLTWVTLGYRVLHKVAPSQKGAPSRRAPYAQATRPQELPRGFFQFLYSLLWLLASLVPGGSRRNDDFRGGGGRFGGGGGSSRSDDSRP